MRINTVDGLAGSAKSYTATKQAVEWAHWSGRKTIIAAPTRKVAEQTFRDALSFRDTLRRSRIPITIITSDRTGNVAKALTDHFRRSASQPDGGEVLICTQSGYMQVPYLHRPDHWHLIVDEIPAVDSYWHRHIPETHGLLTALIDEEEFNATYVRLVPKAGCRAQLDRIARNENNDDIWRDFQPVAKALVSDHWDVYALRENLERTRRRETEPFSGESGGRYPLVLFGLLRPSIFRPPGAGNATHQQVTIMGACFEESLLYFYWSLRGVEWRTNEDITSRLLYREHENGVRLTILCCAEGDYSKTMGRQNVAGTDKPFREHVMEQTRAAFGSSPFAYLVNKDSAALADTSGGRF